MDSSNVRVSVPNLDVILNGANVVTKTKKTRKSKSDKSKSTILFTPVVKGADVILFKSMSDLRDKNKEIGHLFFNHDTMKFWGSKIETALYRGVFFITSEKGVGKEPRTFTIREAKSTGEIVTVGKGREHKTLDEAKDAVKALIKSLNIRNVKKAKVG